MNGAGLVHDFELAWTGETSEDVGPGLDDGLFGMARGDRRVHQPRDHATASTRGSGLGARRRRAPSSARGCRTGALEHPRRRRRLGVPATVHVAVGTDIIHMHPRADGAAIGASQPARLPRCSPPSSAQLDGGVYINLGSAVIMPEVFLKALNLARNVGPQRAAPHHRRHGLHPALPAARERRAAADRRAAARGIRLTGHHEIMFPLLWSAVEEALR